MDDDKADGWMVQRGTRIILKINFSIFFFLVGCRSEHTHTQFGDDVCGFLSCAGLLIEHACWLEVYGRICNVET